MSPRRRTPANRPIRDDTARLDPATTRLPAVEPRTDPVPAVRLDVPDERTPLYDALYAIHGLGGRHALNPHREVPMPGKHGDDDGDGIANQADLDWRPDIVDSGFPTGIPDTGDATDPQAPDPTPEEITHPDHPDYVEPWGG